MNIVVLNLCSIVRRLLTKDCGQDVVEYALVVALIGFGAASSMRPLAAIINVALTSISTNVAAS